MNFCVNSTGLVHAVGCHQRMTARLAVYDSSTRCNHCQICHQRMTYNRPLLLIINRILFDHQITTVQLHIGTPVSYVRSFFLTAFLFAINSLTR